VYFIVQGKVKLVYDVTEGEIDQPYHIPFNMYMQGSYFGDSDVLAAALSLYITFRLTAINFHMIKRHYKKGGGTDLADKTNDGRDGTAIVDAESVVFVITRKELLSVLRMFKDSYSKEMHFIAKERRLHHKAAIDELKL